MQHFTPYRDEYRYRTGNAGEVIQIDVSYHKGRGIFAYINKVTLADGCLSMEVFSGVHALLMPLARKSAKTLAAVTEKLDAIAPEIAAIFAEDKKAAAKLATDRMAA
jgi:hypothetical protein